MQSSHIDAIPYHSLETVAAGVDDAATASVSGYCKRVETVAASKPLQVLAAAEEVTMSLPGMVKLQQSQAERVSP